jgi:hypothetical protein
VRHYHGQRRVRVCVTALVILVGRVDVAEELGHRLVESHFDTLTSSFAPSSVIPDVPVASVKSAPSRSTVNE